MEKTDVKSTLIDMLISEFERAGITTDDVNDDLDLLDSGIVDSFGFINLCMQMEEKFSISVDMSEFDDDGIAVISNLVDMVVQKTISDQTRSE